MNNRKPYMAPATTLYHIEASTMLCGSPGSGNVTETEVRPGEYAPDPTPKQLRHDVRRRVLGR